MNRFQRLAARSLALLVVLGFGTVCFGQNYGSISGTVFDPTGAVIPGASVTATNTATGVASATITLGDGNFVLPQLQPGNYSLAVTADGFRGYVRDDLQVQVSGRLTLSIDLELGSTTDVVTVTETIPLLRTEDAQKSDRSHVVL